MPRPARSSGPTRRRRRSATSFSVQDELTQLIVDSLSLPLTAREQRMLRRDVPASTKAYEFFLRGNQLSYDAKQWGVARDLYVRSCRGRSALRTRVGTAGPYPSRDGQVPRRPGHAKSWIARRRRSAGHSSSIRIWRSRTSCTPSSKSIWARAPTRWLASSGARAARTPSCSPVWSARAVTAACWRRRWPPTSARRRLEPRIRSSIPHTWFLQGDHERVAGSKLDEHPYIVALSLGALGRQQEAVSGLRELEKTTWTRLRDFMVAARTLLEGDAAQSIAAVDRIVDSDFRDPEGLFYLTRHLSHLEEVDRARPVRARRRRRILLLPGDGTRSLAGPAAQEARFHQGAPPGRDCSISTRWRRSRS